MATSPKTQAFWQSLPDITLLAPSSPGWTERRHARGKAGMLTQPLGIAVPKNAQEVASIVRWANKHKVEITVRSGGNDLFGRYVHDQALIIDMRDMASIRVAADKQTATIGGGVVHKDLIYKLETAGVLAAYGSVGVPGYVGWATLGGYGPLTNLLGLGFEGIVGAEVVTAEGEVVAASQDRLEGIRGMGGNLGVITSLTIKVYPTRELLSGMIAFDASRETIDALIAAGAKLEIPKALHFHHIILQMPKPSLAVFFTWAGDDLQLGQQHLAQFLAEMPPPRINTVKAKSVTEHYEAIPRVSLPWGSQRSVHVKAMSSGVVDIVMDAVETMRPGVNIAWTMKHTVDHASTAPNCFGVGGHILLSSSDMVSEESLLPAAAKWNEELYQRLRSSGDEAILESSYASLTRTEDRTAEQLFGDKWPRARELKARYDAGNVFKHAVPKMG